MTQHQSRGHRQIWDGLLKQTGCRGYVLQCCLGQFFGKDSFRGKGKNFHQLLPIEVTFRPPSTVCRSVETGRPAVVNGSALSQPSAPGSRNFSTNWLTTPCMMDSQLNCPGCHGWIDHHRMELQASVLNTHYPNRSLFDGVMSDTGANSVNRINFCRRA